MIPEVGREQNVSYGVSVLTCRLKQLQNEVIKLIFPAVCISCGKFGDFICVDCEKKLSRLLPPICQRCGKPESSAQYCPECWRKQSDLSGIRSVFIFEGIIRTAVHELKYYHLRAISSLLGEYMAIYYRDNALSCDYLIPVPLHPKRFGQRGYNQSELLTAKMSEITGVPMLNDAIVRVIDNEPQARTVSVEERRHNVENVFSCKNSLVRGKEVMIVDDVCTSGATLEACAKSLIGGGAKKAFGITLARELLNRSL